MITIHVKDIVNNTEIFNSLLEKKLKGRSAFLLARIIRELGKEQEAFQETRNKLIYEYGEEEENGTFKIKPENIQEFNQQIEQLLNTTIEINSDPIKLEDLQDFEFTPAQMIVLEPFINE